MLQNLRIWSQEETLRQKRCAPREAWDMEKSVHKFKKRHKAPFFSPSDDWRFPAPSSKPEGRPCVVDCGASRDMLGKKKSQFSRFGNRSCIEELHNGHHSQWRSADERRISCRQRSGLVRDGAAPPGNAQFSVAWTTLRRSLIFL